MSIRRLLSTIVFVFAFVLSMSAATTTTVACDPSVGSGLC